MRNEVKTTFAAASAALAAAQAAVAARNLLYRDPTAWDFADQAYWLCRAAAGAAEKAADALDAAWAETEAGVADAHAAATQAASDATNEADNLVSLAGAAGHTIRR